MHTMTHKSPMVQSLSEHDVQISKPMFSQSKNDIETLRLIKKQLRRLKRRLFLQAIKEPETNVDKFRQLITNLALDESSTAETSSSGGSYRSFPSMQSIHEGAIFASPVGNETARLDCIVRPPLVQ